MDPITAILSAAALAGAIKGGQRKYLDPEWLKANYGTHAVTQEAQDLFSRMIHSPQGQQIINSASEAGQSFGRGTQAQAAAAGMTPAGGAATGTGIFSTAAGDSAANTATAQTKASMYEQALPVAADIVGQRRDAAINDFYRNGAPTNSALQWQKIGNAAGIGLSAASTARSFAPGTQAPLTVGPQGNASVRMGPAMVGGPMAGVQIPRVVPRQPSWMQKSQRLFSGFTSRFAQPQPNRFNDYSYSGPYGGQ
jgi:hypothetical protein